MSWLQKECGWIIDISVRLNKIIRNLMIPSLVQWIKGTSIAAAAAWISSPGLGNSIYHECNHTKGKKKKKKNSSSNKPFLKELHSVLLSTMKVVCLKGDEKGEGWCLLLRKCFQTVAYMPYITLSADLVQVLLNSKGSHDS